MQDKAPDIADAPLGADIILDDELAGIDLHGAPEMEYRVDIIMDIEKADSASMAEINRLLGAKNGDTTVVFRFPINGKEVVVDTGRENYVTYSPDLREELIGISGVTEVNLVQNQSQ